MYVSIVEPRSSELWLSDHDLVLAYMHTLTSNVNYPNSRWSKRFCLVPGCTMHTWRTCVCHLCACSKLHSIKANQSPAFLEQGQSVWETCFACINFSHLLLVQSVKHAGRSLIFLVLVTGNGMCTRYKYKGRFLLPLKVGGRWPSVQWKTWLLMAVELIKHHCRYRRALYVV